MKIQQLRSINSSTLINSELKLFSPEHWTIFQMNLGFIGKQFMSIQTRACTCLKLVKFEVEKYLDRVISCSKVNILHK